MSNGRIPWSRYAGEDVEAVVAMLLLSDNPHGRRMLPSKGDGGIDILVRTGPRTIDVYQVKRYSTRLTSTHQTNITKSWNSMRSYTKSQSLTATNWFVVRPRDATKEDESWLRSLTDGSGIPTMWLGEANIDAWAARHPSVIDYYLRDGRDRALDITLQALRAAGFVHDATEGSITNAFDAEEGLMALYRTVNEVDPHYRYELHVEKAHGDVLDVPTAIPSDLAYTAISEKDDVRVRVDVFTRYDLAIEDSPLDLSAILKPSTPEENEAVSNLLEYGLGTTSIPIDITTTNIPLLSDSGQSKSTTLTVLPAAGGLHAGTYSLWIDARAGFPAVNTTIDMNGITTGVSDSTGRGWSGTMAGGFLTVQLTWHEGSNSADLLTVCAPILGGLAVDVARAVATQKLLLCGAPFRISLPDGPVVFEIHDEDEEDPVVLPERDMVDALVSLAALQQVVPARLHLPPDVETLAGEATGWSHAARLLRGETVRSTWTQFSFTIESSEPVVFPTRFRVISQATARVAGRRWPIGIQVQDGVAGAWSKETDSRGYVAIRPGADPELATALSTDPMNDKALLGRVLFATKPDQDSGQVTTL